MYISKPATPGTAYGSEDPGIPDEGVVLIVFPGCTWKLYWDLFFYLCVILEYVL